jgi:hypothetical protein
VTPQQPVAAAARAAVRNTAMLSALLLGPGGCGDASNPPSTTSMSTPQALRGCDGVAEALQARLWVSGFADPFALDVDEQAGTTSGEVRVPPGIVRRFTFDWFIEREGRVILLAQARDELDLSSPSSETATLTMADEDLSTTSCDDMSADSFNGAATIDVDGTDRPVCDLDDDGASNLAEVCAGDDPLVGPP